MIILSIETDKRYGFLAYIEHRLMRFKEVVEGRWVDRALSENDQFFEFSLCLSRACLGRMIVSIFKIADKTPVFLPALGRVRTETAVCTETERTCLCDAYTTCT